MRRSAIPALVLLLAVAGPPARAMTITRLFSFDSSSGWRPEAPLLEASDGNFYGTASLEGSDGTGCAQSCVGTIFKLTPQGQLTLLHVFTGAGTPTFANGSTPKGGLVEGPDGWLYGTTYSGGAAFHSYGIVYKISKTGVFQKIHDFCPTAPCPDGANPVGNLAWGSDGNLYGTTTAPLIKPYIFRISPGGSYAAIAHFQDNPLGTPASGLLRASDGNLYGVARNGVYRVSSSGVITPLYFFGTIAQDGSLGQGPLIQGTDGNLYGATLQGGANNNGIVFKISTSGAYAKIFDIVVATEGLYPNALCQTPDTNLWGTTSNNSAAAGGGAVYSISTSGALQEASFLNNTTGFTSIANLIQASDGKLYGTSTAGGQFGSGTVFVVDDGLPAPVPGESSSNGSMRVASFDRATGDITVTYDAACFATDHHVVYGPLASVATYAYSDQACNLGETGIATFNPGVGSFFWVLVANTATLEGSYGRRTGDIERPAAVGLPGCGYLQQLSAACP